MPQKEELGFPVDDPGMPGVSVVQPGLHPNEPGSNPISRENIGAALGGMSPEQYLQNYIIKSMSGGASTGGGGTPGIVGAPPPELVPRHLPPGINLPGMASGVSPFQAGGPAARQAPYQNAGAMEHRSKAGRDAAIIGNAIQGLSQFAVQQKQKAFESEAAQMQQYADAVMNSTLVTEKVKRGEQVTMQDLQSKAAFDVFGGDEKHQKKLLKLIDKAQQDPTSGAYVGLQRAYAGQMARVNQQAEVERLRSETAKNYGEAFQKYHAGQYMGGLSDVNKAAMAVRALEQGKAVEERAATDKARQEEQKRKNLADEGFVLFKDANGVEHQRPMKWDEMGAALRSKIESKVREDANQRARIWQQHDLQAKRLNLEQDKFKFDQWYKREMLTAKKDSAKAKALGDPKIIAQIQDRMSRGSLTADYAQQLIDLVGRRPDMFGMMGAGKNMIKKMFAEQDPDAALFEDIANRLGITVVGMHTRSAVLARDNMNSLHGFWKSPEALISRLQAIKQAGDDIASGKDWPAAIPRPSTISPEGIRPSTVAPSSQAPSKPSTSPKEADPFSQFGGYRSK